MIILLMSAVTPYIIYSARNVSVNVMQILSHNTENHHMSRLVDSQRLIVVCNFLFFWQSKNHLKKLISH